jgi:uncharacterized protein involved in response to NO
MNEPGKHIDYILEIGLRPFFFAAGSYAVIAMALWLGSIAGVITIPTMFNPVFWHAHEMLFGFVAAAIAGFLLTAIPNWTGRLPVHGPALGLLVLVWLAGRIGVATSGIIGNWAAGFLDVSFLLLLSLVFCREIIAGKNWKNLVVVIPVFMLACVNTVIHGGMIGLWSNMTAEALFFGLFFVLLLLSVIAGRVIPSFTRNWLKQQNASRFPVPFGRFDVFTTFAILILLVVLMYGNDV